MDKKEFNSDSAFRWDTVWAELLDPGKPWASFFYRELLGEDYINGLGQRIIGLAEDGYPSDPTDSDDRYIAVYTDHVRGEICLQFFAGRPVDLGRQLFSTAVSMSAAATTRQFGTTEDYIMPSLTVLYVGRISGFLPRQDMISVSGNSCVLDYRYNTVSVSSVVGLSDIVAKELGDVAADKFLAGVKYLIHNMPEVEKSSELSQRFRLLMSVLNMNHAYQQSGVSIAVAEDMVDQVYWDAIGNQVGTVAGGKSGGVRPLKME